MSQHHHLQEIATGSHPEWLEWRIVEPMRRVCEIRSRLDAGELLLTPVYQYRHLWRGSLLELASRDILSNSGLWQRHTSLRVHFRRNFALE